MPDKPDGDKSTVKNISRRALLKKYGIESPEMPECDAEYLIHYLFEIGPVMPGGMGDAPISHGEISAWINLTGIHLQPWEVRFLRRLSIEYINESQAATAHGALSPWEAAAPVAALALRADQEFCRMDSLTLA